MSEEQVSVRPDQLRRLELLEAILPHCEPDKACLQNDAGQFAWLYTKLQVASAVAAWRAGELPSKCYETTSQRGNGSYVCDRPVRLGLVPHREGKVGVFMIDLDAHDGGRDTTGLCAKLERFLGAPAVVFTSKGGKGLHLVYRLKKPQPVKAFVKWAKSWGFNREGGAELFPKTHRLTQIWMPNEPNGLGGDTYVSGDFGTASIRELPPALPQGLSGEVLRFLMGMAEPGNRNDLLNKAAFALAQKGFPARDAEAVCMRAAKLCGLEESETEATFHSGHNAGCQAVGQASVGRVANRQPEISVNNRQLPDISVDAWKCVRAVNADSPRLFLSGGAVARINNNGEQPIIQQLDRVGMISSIARVAQWVRASEDSTTNVFPPARVADDMLHCPDTSLPVLESIVASPVFDAGGRLLVGPGYHPTARVWHEPSPGFEMPPVPERPTDAEVRAARELVLEIVCDFSFVSAADRAHCVAAFLLPFVRRMIRGCTPLHLFEAPSYGSGKSKLPDVVSRLALGRPIDPTVLPADNEECRKKLTAALAKGSQLILLDNTSRLLSEVLAAVLTCEVWSDRLLGATRILSLSNRAVWLATSNNPTMTLEIARRTLRIRIDTRTEHPWLREGFKHHPLLQWVDDNRARILHAIFTLVRAWLARGRPLCSRTLGSFEHWAQVMGGILECVGIDQFLGNLDDFYDRLDTEGRMWRDFCAAAFERFGGRSARVNEYASLCAEKELLLPVRGDKNEKSQCIKLGKALQRVSDRIFGDYVVVPALDRHAKSQMYSVVVVQKGDDTSAGSGGELRVCQSDTSRKLTPVATDTSDGVRDVAGCLVPPYTGGSDGGSLDGGVVGRGPRQNIPQHPAEPVKSLAGNEIACGMLRSDYPQTTRNIPQIGRSVPDTTSVDIPADPNDWPDEWRHVFAARVVHLRMNGRTEDDARREAREFAAALWRESKAKGDA